MQCCHQEALYTQLDFGKHKGRDINQVHYEYLQWMLRCFPESSLWHNAALETARRKGTQRELQNYSVHALLSDLKACSMRRDLQWGRRIHASVTQSGNESNMYVATAVIRMYANCGSMLDAHRVFDLIQKPDVVSWSTLLMGYAENGEAAACLELFSKMKAAGCMPNSVAYVAAFKACTYLAVHGNCRQGLRIGSEIHVEIGDQMNPYVQTTLIDMYSKCGSMADARRVFDRIQKPDVVSWTALLLGYAENGEGYVSLELFFKMKSDGCAPNYVTYVAALKACSSLAVNGDEDQKTYGLKMGYEIHSQMGNYLELSVQNTLIDMYAKCGSMISARKVFDNLQSPDIVSWNTLLLGYAENGEEHVCLELFSKMKAGRCLPNSITFIAALKACTLLAVNRNEAQGLEMGKKIHLEIGDHLNLSVESTLIDMYSKCGSMVEARCVFDTLRNPDVVSWTALLLGHAANGEATLCLQLFSKMKAGGCTPNSVTYIAALQACTFLAADGEKALGLELGTEIHLEIGEQLDLYVQNTLVDMYAKCGSMVKARQVFDTIQKPQVVSWNALLLGYVENGEGNVVLNLFSRMKADGCAPNTVTYTAALKACRSLGALSLGRKFHSEITEFTENLVTCLVDFYAKCASMIEARAVFDLHSNARDSGTWTVLLTGYSTCGDTVSVLKLFEEMRAMGSRPDSVTFLCLLSCCSHAGLVEKAKEFLEAMSVHYSVAPDVFHYSCMVDALGRANQLSEAVSLLREMPCSPNVVTWTALLAACRKWKNVEIASVAFQSLQELGKADASAYVLMAHIYRPPESPEKF